MNDEAPHTRCPACLAVYEIGAAGLAEASGMATCGNCGQTFNCLANLFAHRPEVRDTPLTGSGMPPRLEHPSMRQADLPGMPAAPPEAAAPEADDRDGEPPADDAGPANSGPGMLWPALCALFALALGLQLATLWSDPDHTTAGGKLPTDQAIQVVARDLHAHPSLDDAMVLSTTLKNQAGHHIGYPVIELRLYDASQQILGVRRLTPAEYLPRDREMAAGLEAGAMLPLVLELIAPGTEPSGFRMRFY